MASRSRTTAGRRAASQIGMRVPRRSERWYAGGHRLLRQLGLSGVCDYCWCEVLTLDGAAAPVSGWNAESLWLGEFGPAQLAWLEALAPERAGEFPARWRAGRRCFAALLDDGGAQRAVGYVWVAVGPTRLPGQRGLHWELPPGCVWFYDAYSHPLVVGTYPDLVRYADRQLRREGCTAFLGQVEFHNTHSRRVHRRLGAAPAGWLLQMKLAGLKVRVQRQPGGWRWGLNPGPVRLGEYLPASPPAAAAGASARAA